MELVRSDLVFVVGSALLAQAWRAELAQLGLALD
jgi:hypothetical protein